MNESRELAKKNWKGSGDAAVEDIWFGIKDKLGATEFLGYETNQAGQPVLINNDQSVRSASTQTVVQQETITPQYNGYGVMQQDF